jgi:hypothetical protein
MEETHRSEELTLVELEAQHIELLPDREEMNTWFSNNAAAAVAINGSAAAANAGNVFIFAVGGGPEA